MSYKLNVYPDAKLVKKKKRIFRAKKREAIRSKVKKLVEARFVREVTYPKLLANPVLVKKV